MEKALIGLGLTNPFNFGSVVARWLRNARTRAALGHLTQEQLADINLSKTDAQKEAAKWFWQH